MEAVKPRQFLQFKLEGFRIVTALSTRNYTESQKQYSCGNAWFSGFASEGRKKTRKAFHDKCENKAIRN
jgi:hypothetical protein